MLAAGTGDALYWAAALTVGLPDGCELLMHRLGGCYTAGLHHLFDRLKGQGCRMTPSRLAVLENGLVNRGAKTAVSAARWCEDAASNSDTWLVELLRSASSYRLENEEPYPESVGTVPDSPREALLRTSCGIAPPAFEELVKLARNPKSDVKDAAIDGVKWFPPRQYEKLLDSSVPYRSEELSILCALCRDQDPAHRLVWGLHT